MVRSRRWLFAYFVLVFVAVTLAFPFGRYFWGRYWPEPKLGFEFTGGTKYVLQAKSRGKVPAGYEVLLRGIFAPRRLGR